MQFSCDSCKTQLQIADEKLRGKRLIVRCRRCGAKIALADPALPKSAPRVISPPEPAVRIAPPAASPADTSQPPGEGRGADVEITRAMESEVLERALQASAVDAPPQNGTPQRTAPVAAPADGAVWFAMLHGKQTGPLTRGELESRASEGEVGPRTYLWREGMDSWQRARDVGELGPMFPQFPGSLLPPQTPTPAPPAKERPAPTPEPPVPPRQPPPPRQPASAQTWEPASAQTWQMGEGVAKDELREPVPGLPPDRGAADVARELFASGEHSISQKNAMDLARWATDELGRKKDHAAEQPRISPPVVAPAAQMFESAAPKRGRGAVIIFLGLAALAGTALVLWILLSAASDRPDDPRPPPQEQAQHPPVQAAQPAAKPAETQALPQAKPPDPASAAGSSSRAGLTADEVHRKLDENKPFLQGCIDDALRRDPRLRVGKIHVATTIAPSGQVTAARIDKRAVDESPLGACLKRATRRILFPPFAGQPFDVDIPIVVTAGD